MKARKTKADRIREYLQKYPAADVAKVAAKFETTRPVVYKLRKELSAAHAAAMEGDATIEEVMTWTAQPGDGSLVLGRKFDAGKLDYSLVPFEAMDEVVKVLMYGAQKYERENWRHVPEARQRYSAAALRHMTAHIRGETTDQETGLSHLAHAGCCVLFLLALEQGAKA